jgi:hypothetical protein
MLNIVLTGTGYFTIPSLPPRVGHDIKPKEQKRINAIVITVKNDLFLLNFYLLAPMYWVIIYPHFLAANRRN